MEHGISLEVFGFYARCGRLVALSPSSPERATFE
jgi:hypothetical protein